MHHPDPPSLTARGIGARASGAAQDLVRQVDGRLARATGRPAAAWLAEVRRSVRDHPLNALGAAVAAGYLLGKLLWRK